MPGLFCTTGALKDGWLTAPGRAGISRLPYAHFSLTLHNRHTLHVRVPGSTRSVDSPSLSLWPVSLPTPWLPWISSQDSVAPDHFFEFSKTRVWGRKWSVRELRRERERERPIPCFFFFFALLQTRSVHSHPRTFARTVLSAVPVSPPTSFLRWALLPHRSHSQSRPPNPPPLFVPLCCFPSSYSIFLLLLPEILVFVVTTCFQNYLYETLPKERLSSVRADIALSGGKARVAQWEVEGIRGWREAQAPKGKAG